MPRKFVATQFDDDGTAVEAEAASGKKPSGFVDYNILRIDEGGITARVVGTTPLILNAMPAKARQQLFFPPPPVNRAERQGRLKHDPYEEFRQSCYMLREDDAKTLMAGLGAWFKQSIMTAALDQPGTKKAQIGRLVRVPADKIPVFGEPQIMCSVVRSADINHTPDVRTRCIIPHWACEVTLHYAQPLIKEQAVVHLLAAAGVTSGVGDWRTEKGSADYGSFRIAGADDQEYDDIIGTWGRAAQKSAFRHPMSYDNETDELLSWFGLEAPKRGFSYVKPETLVPDMVGAAAD